MDQDLAEVYDACRPRTDDHAVMIRLIGMIQELRDGIRRHRDQQGDDRCHMDDGELYLLLPEKKLADTQLPPKEEFLKSCSRFWEERQHPREKGLHPLGEADMLVEQHLRSDPETLCHLMAQFLAQKGLVYEADSFIRAERRQ